MAGDEIVQEAAGAMPSAALRGLVAHYHGYRQRGLPPARHLGLPSPYLTLIVTLDEPLQLARHVDASRPPGAYATLTGGLHAAPVVITHDGAQSGIQLAVHPLAARQLFGMPACELAGVDVDGRDVLGAAADELHDRVRSATDWPQRFAALERVLAGLSRDSAPVADAVARAWSLLVCAGGTIPISRLAREVGYGERHLGNRFRAEIGLTPKTAARVIRFDRARRLLQAGTDSVAAVAARCGYYDQSHLVRDFVEFAGLPPTAWLAQEFGNVQAGNVDAGRDWAS